LAPFAPIGTVAPSQKVRDRSKPQDMHVSAPSISTVGAAHEHGIFLMHKFFIS
jgi:hypothetical protein